MNSPEPAAIQDPKPPPAHSSQLLRVLGPGIAIAIVVGNTIGSGIFAKPSVIATASGSFPIIISGWILGGVICLFGALCFAELSAMLPRAGGLYVFLREAYGRPVAFLFGLNEYVFGRTATNGALSVLFATLCCAPFLKANEVPHPWLQAIIACVVIVGLTAINVLGVIWGGRVQGLTTLIKAGFLGLIALLPFLFLVINPTNVQWSNYASTIEPKYTSLSAQFAVIMLAVMWAYNGWHDIAPVAEEVRDPQRNIPLALIGGILILILLYVGANVAYHGVLTMDQIASARRNTAQETIKKTLMPLGEFLALAGANGITLVTMFSVFGALNSNFMLGPRIAFAMARDGLFWRPLAHVHPHFHTPAVSIMAQAVMSCGLVIVGTLLIVNIDSLIVVLRQIDLFDLFKNTTDKQLREVNLFELFTNFVVYSANIFYALCVLGVYVLRWKHPEWERPYRTWGYPVVPALYLLGMCWFLKAAYDAEPLPSNVALILMLCGLPVYFVMTYLATARPSGSP